MLFEVGHLTQVDRAVPVDEAAKLRTLAVLKNTFIGGAKLLFGKHKPATAVEEVVSEFPSVFDGATGASASAHLEGTLDPLVHVPEAFVLGAVALPGHSALAMSHVVSPLTKVDCSFIAGVTLPTHHVAHLSMATSLAVFKQALVDTSVLEVNAAVTVKSTLFKDTIEMRLV